ncbi:5'/3'-nucleotidase SurE [Kitasatospora sp. HPMI-4]|uniref:5'/3'-nucleotidase SurE n=1 Tax=Kitasatospora sp. HPMI-4 TaxID=3448443 RepID=UPI003F1DC772
MDDTDVTGRPRILVTNDDGIDSPGLHHLARAACALSPHVVVAAPREETSGSSAALTAVEDQGRVVVERRDLPDLDGVLAHAVAAAPAFIAMLAGRGAFGPAPHIVLSGINRGPNTGRATLHSGTVGAALTASLDGCRTMALSLDVGDTWHWETAAAVTTRLLPLLALTDPGAVINVNIPNLPLGEVRGIRHAVLAPFGTVQTTVTDRGHGYIAVTLTETDTEPGPDSDAALLADGWTTLSLLNALSTTAAPDRLMQALHDLSATGW